MSSYLTGLRGSGGGSLGKGGSAGLSRLKVVVSRDGTLGFARLLVVRYHAQFAVDVPSLGRRGSGGGGSGRGSGCGGCSLLGFVTPLQIFAGLALSLGSD